MRCCGSPALPGQATSARGRCLRGLQEELGEGAPAILVRDCWSATRTHSSPERCRSFQSPARQPRWPCAIPGERREPSRRRGGAGVGGCRTHPAAAPTTPQLRRIWLGGPAKERARSAGQSAGRTDRRTDAPAHADAQSSARPPSLTLTHTHSRPHRDTRTLARSHPPASLPARPSPAPGSRSPLWPVSVASPSVPLCGEPEGERRRVLPKAALQLRPPPAPQGREAGSRPRHAPMGLLAPLGWGRGPPRRGGGWALGSCEGVAATPHGAWTRFRVGIG